MKRTLLGQFLDECKKDDGRPYDFIANHYWEMDKMTLKDILLECLCVDENIVGLSHEEIVASLATNLEERFEDDYFNEESED